MSKERLTVTCDEDLREEFEEVRERGGWEHTATAGRELLSRGIESWQREQAQPPGMQFIRQMVVFLGLAAVLSLAVALAVPSSEVWRLVGILAGADVVVATVYGGALLHARRVAGRGGA